MKTHLLSLINAGMLYDLGKIFENAQYKMVSSHQFKTIIFVQFASGLLLAFHLFFRTRVCLESESNEANKNTKERMLAAYPVLSRYD